MGNKMRSHFMVSANETEDCFSLVIELLEERDLSFAEFGPKRSLVRSTRINEPHNLAKFLVSRQGLTSLLAGAIAL
jgi:hypothetical protein